MKQLIKGVVGLFGYEVRRARATPGPGDKAWFSLSDPSLDGPMGTDLGPAASMQALLEHLRARDFAPRAVLDVGANRGKWSRMAKRVFPRADCFLIEPQKEMKAFLEPFCREYPGSKWFMAGAGASPSELTLTVTDDSVSSTFLPGESSGSRRRVPVIAINSLLDSASMPTPELVKLDVEGFELEALSGGDQLFGKTEAFILEVMPHGPLEGRPVFHQVVAFMADRGYYVYDFPVFHRPDPGGVLGAVDVCFARHKGALSVR